MIALTPLKLTDMTCHDKKQIYAPGGTNVQITNVRIRLCFIICGYYKSEVSYFKKILFNEKLF